MSVHITNTDFLKLLLQTDIKYRDSYWVLQTREHLEKMSDITGRRLSKEESIVKESLGFVLEMCKKYPAPGIISR